MTICIGALGASFDYIVAACDYDASTDFFSGDLMLKANTFPRQWGCMWSTNDLSHVPSIVDRSRTIMKGKAKHSLQEVADGLCKAYQLHAQTVAENRFLSPFGITMAEFVRNGEKLLTPSVSRDVARQIQELQLSCEFLVFGFDLERQPHLFVVSEHGDVSYADRIGFAAIGTGCPAALNMLRFHGRDVGHDLPRTIYHVCEAKFMSEQVSKVGTETFVIIMDKKGGCKFLWPEQIERIKSLWIADGQPRVPTLLDRVVTEQLNGSEVHSKNVKKR